MRESQVRELRYGPFSIFLFMTELEWVTDAPG